MDIPRLPTDLIISILKERKNMIEKEKEEIKNNKNKFNNTIKELNKFYDCFYDEEEYLEEFELNLTMDRLKDFKKGEFISFISTSDEEINEEYWEEQRREWEYHN